MNKTFLSRLTALVCGFVLQTALLAGQVSYAYAEASRTVATESFATAAEIVKSGICGENVTWSLDDAGTLTISGTGDMEKWDSTFSAPWYRERELIINAKIEAGITNIANCAFYNCINLSDIAISDSVTKIGNQVFYGCKALASISIPEKVTTIGIRAFSQCSNLINITLSEGLLNIGDCSFENCESLQSIIIPESITRIGIGAFSACKNLVSVTINSLNCEIDDRPDTFCNGGYYEDYPFTGTIYGYFGSTAETYAKKYGRVFVDLNAPETTTTIATTTTTSTTKPPTTTTTATSTMKPTTMTTTTSTTKPTTTTTTTISSTTKPITTTNTSTTKRTITTTTFLSGTTKASVTSSDTTTNETTITSKTTQSLSCDYNGDGKVSIADAVLLARFIAEDETLTKEQIDSILNAKIDFDNDMLITIIDLRLLLSSDELVIDEPIITGTQTTTTATTTTTTTSTTTTSTTTTTTTTSTTVTTTTTTTMPVTTTSGNYLSDSQNYIVQFTNYSTNEYGDYVISGIIENLSDRKLLIGIDDVTVNDLMLDPFWATSVAPKAKTTVQISFSKSQLENNNITQITKIAGELHVSDDDTWDRIATEKFTLCPMGEAAVISYVHTPVPNEQVLFNDAYFTFIITGYNTDKYGDYVVSGFIENKCDKDLLIGIDDVTVNGLMLDPFWATTVAAKAKANISFSFSKSQLDKNGLAQVTQIAGDIHVSDDDTLDRLLTDKFVLYPLGEGAVTLYTHTPVENEQILFNNENYLFIITGYSTDKYGDYVVSGYFENKTDRDLLIGLDDVTVNDWMVDPFWATTVVAKAKANIQISFSKSKLDSNSITKVTKIAGEFHASDDDTWDRISTERFTLIPFE